MVNTRISTGFSSEHDGRCSKGATCSYAAAARSVVCACIQLTRSGASTSCCFTHSAWSSSRLHVFDALSPCSCSASHCATPSLTSCVHLTMRRSLAAGCTCGSLQRCPSPGHREHKRPLLHKQWKAARTSRITPRALGLRDRILDCLAGRFAQKSPAPIPPGVGGITQSAQETCTRLKRSLRRLAC